MSVKYETGSWHDFIVSYQVLSQHQKVGQNRPGGGDYGLSHHWHYSFGNFLDSGGSPVWYVVFVRVHPAKQSEMENLCCDSRLGSVMLVKNGDGSFSLRMSDHAMIANYLWVQNLTEVPEQLAYMLGEDPSVEGLKSAACST